MICRELLVIFIISYCILISYILYSSIFLTFHPHYKINEINIQYFNITRKRLVVSKELCNFAGKLLNTH